MLAVPPCATRLTRAKSTALASALDFRSDASELLVLWLPLVALAAANSWSGGFGGRGELKPAPRRLMQPGPGVRENELYNSRMRCRPVTPTDLLSCLAAEVTAGMTNFVRCPQSRSHRPHVTSSPPSLTNRESFILIKRVNGAHRFTDHGHGGKPESPAQCGCQ